MQKGKFHVEYDDWAEVWVVTDTETDEVEYFDDEDQVNEYINSPLNEFYNSFRESNKKKTVRESLKEMDYDTDYEYDLVSTYDSMDWDEESESELSDKISTNDVEEVSDYLTNTYYDHINNGGSPAEAIEDIDSSISELQGLVNQMASGRDQIVNAMDGMSNLLNYDNSYAETKDEFIDDDFFGEYTLDDKVSKEDDDVQTLSDNSDEVDTEVEIEDEKTDEETLNEDVDETQYWDSLNFSAPAKGATQQMIVQLSKRYAKKYNLTDPEDALVMALEHMDENSVDTDFSQDEYDDLLNEVARATGLEVKSKEEQAVHLFSTLVDKNAQQLEKDFNSGDISINDSLVNMGYTPIESRINVYERKFDTYKDHLYKLVFDLNDWMSEENNEIHYQVVIDDDYDSPSYENSILVDDEDPDEIIEKEIEKADEKLQDVATDDIAMKDIDEHERLTAADSTFNRNEFEEE